MAVFASKCFILWICALLRLWSSPENTEGHILRETKSHKGLLAYPSEGSFTLLAKPCTFLCVLMSQPASHRLERICVVQGKPCESLSPNLCTMKLCVRRRPRILRRYRRDAVRDVLKIIEVAVPGGDQILEKLREVTGGASGVKKI
ncbi:hypothetical protein V5799_028051 [Amblyomma americanum]|uniref:Secreted protein n=1 Tax=Amblyomma americanum TaxID=6943 RepID=A0AAQ4DDZ2_AMBAM